MSRTTPLRSRTPIRVRLLATVLLLSTPFSAWALNPCKLFPGHPTLCPCDCDHYGALQAVGKAGICSKAERAAIQKNCPGTINDCANLDAQLQEARERLKISEEKHQHAQTRWAAAHTALGQARSIYTETEQKLKAHTQQTFATAASYLECINRFGTEELKAKVEQLLDTYINDCIFGERDPSGCEGLDKEIERVEKHKDLTVGKCRGPKELWERELAYWNELYKEELPLRERDYNTAAIKESHAADNLQTATERLQRAKERLEKLEQEYREKCDKKKSD